MTARPEWLAEALDAHRPQTLDLSSTDKSDLCPGDLWVFESASEEEPVRRIVLILDTEGAQVHAALVSNERDLATRDDVVLPGEEAGITYPIVIETLFHARLWWRYAVERVGALTSERLDQVLDLVWGEEAPELGELRGGALPDGSSVAEFQRDEFRDLRRLAATSDPRFGETVEPVRVVDPGVLLAPDLDLKTATEIAHLVSDGSTSFCLGLASSGSPVQWKPPRADLGPALGALMAYATGRLLSQHPHARTLRDGDIVRTVVTSFGGAWFQTACALSVPCQHDESDLDEPFAFLEGVPVIRARGF